MDTTKEMIFSILVLVCCIHYVAGMCGGEWHFDKLYQFQHQSNILLNSQYGRYEIAVKGKYRIGA